jgi:hypothetical protein
MYIWRNSKADNKSTTTATTKKQKASTSTFPSAYTFETSEEAEAKRRRAQRFEREREIEASKNANQLQGFIPRQVVGHPGVGGALDVTAGADGGGAVRPSQMGIERGVGGWLGGRMGATDTEVDPVSCDLPACRFSFPDLVHRRRMSSTGINTPFAERVQTLKSAIFG